MLAIQLPDEIEQRLDAARNAKFRLVRIREAAQVGLDDLDAGRCRSFADGTRLGRYLAERAKTVLGSIAG